MKYCVKNDFLFRYTKCNHISIPELSKYTGISYPVCNLLIKKSYQPNANTRKKLEHYFISNNIEFNGKKVTKEDLFEFVE